MPKAIRAFCPPDKVLIGKSNLSAQLGEFLHEIFHFFKVGSAMDSADKTAVFPAGHAALKAGRKP